MGAEYYVLGIIIIILSILHILIDKNIIDEKKGKNKSKLIFTIPKSDLTELGYKLKVAYYLLFVVAICYFFYLAISESL